MATKRRCLILGIMLLGFYLDSCQSAKVDDSHKAIMENREMSNGNYSGNWKRQEDDAEIVCVPNTDTQIVCTWTDNEEIYTIEDTTITSDSNSDEGTYDDTGLITWTSGDHWEKVDCPEVFATAVMLYCNGACGDDWLDEEVGCQQPDADAFCKLTLCSEFGYARSYVVSKATYEPGFGCEGRDAYGGLEYGDWFGMHSVHFSDDVRETYGYGDVVSEVKCLTSGCTVHGSPGDGSERGTCAENNLCSPHGCYAKCLVQGFPAEEDNMYRGDCAEGFYCMKDGHCHEAGTTHSDPWDD